VNFISKLWLKLHNNPWFVAFSTALGTTLYAQAQSFVSTGVFNESRHYWIATVIGAAMVATASVYHLNLTPQNPTVLAAFPPSTTKVEVPAQLEPVDPRAVAANPTSK